MTSPSTGSAPRFDAPLPQSPRVRRNQETIRLDRNGLQLRRRIQGRTPADPGRCPGTVHQTDHVEVRIRPCLRCQPPPGPNSRPLVPHLRSEHCQLPGAGSAESIPCPTDPSRGTTSPHNCSSEGQRGRYTTAEDLTPLRNVHNTRVPKTPEKQEAGTP